MYTIHKERKHFCRLYHFAVEEETNMNVRRPRRSLLWLKREGITPFQIITIVLSLAALIVQIMKWSNP